MVVMGFAFKSLEDGARDTTTEFSAAVELSETRGFSTVEGSGDIVPVSLTTDSSS